MRVSVVRGLENHPLAVLLLLAGLATLSYANTFSASFHFDDGPNIVDNHQIKELASFRDVSGSRYVGFLSFAVNYRLGGLAVAGYHLVNLAIHMTNGWLVYTLVGLLLRTPGLGAASVGLSPRQAQGVALTTALLFVAHPIQTQAVTYVVQRFTSLATLWYLLAVVCYLHWRLADTGPRSGWYAGALAATLLAMKTKEISFTLPALLLVVEGGGFARPRGTRWGPLVPFFLTLLIIPLSLPGGFGETDAGFARQTTDISRLSYLLTQSRVLVTYLRLVLLPIQQNLDYDYPVYDSLLAPPVLLSGLGLLCLLGLAAYLLVGSTRWRLVGFGLGWFFLTLAVESSLIPIRDVIFEHRLYLPSVGIFLAGSAVAVPLLARWRVPALLLGVGVVLLFAVATYQRNRVWHDAVSLWTDVVSHSPRKAQAHNNLGAAYVGQGRWEEAIQHYAMALQHKPDFLQAHYNLGIAYLHQGRLEEAIAELVATIQLNPELPYVHLNLGRAYARQQRWEDAITEFSVGLRLKPDIPEAHASLGDAYAAQGRLEDAIQAYRTALRLKPDAPDVHNNLGILYARHGRSDEAMAEFTAALQLQPEFPEAHYNLGSVYARLGRLDAAIAEYLTAVRLKPDVPEVQFDLGNAYQLQGRTQEARRHFELAVRLQPDFAPAQQALAALDRPPHARR